jgi:hypothetical protein
VGQADSKVAVPEELDSTSHFHGQQGHERQQDQQSEDALPFRDAQQAQAAESFYIEVVHRFTFL